ncbi:MAG: sigma factor [Candidatus Korobacteraceae bacterium]
MTLEQDQRISEVVKREQSRLCNFIRRRVPDPLDAEDILQEVFYELVEANRLGKVRADRPSIPSIPLQPPSAVPPHLPDLGRQDSRDLPRCPLPAPFGGRSNRDFFQSNGRKMHSQAKSWLRFPG